MSDIKKQVLDTLVKAKKDGKEFGMKNGEIAQDTGLETKDIAKAIKELKDEGQVESLKRCFSSVK